MTKSRKVEFEGATGATLAARLELPSNEPVAWAVFAHCFTCSKDVFAAARISRALAEFDIAVLRFDFTGLGGSEGDFANTNFSSNVADLLRAVDHLRREHQAPQLLIGHSLGGAAVLAAAPDVPEAVAVATIGAPSDPAHVSHLFECAIDQIERDGEAPVVLAGRTFRIQKQFLEDIEEQRLRERVRGLGKALMVFHSPVDEIVDIDHARRIYAAAEHPKSFVTLADADHLLTRPEDSRYVASVLAAWAARYIETVDDSREDALEPGVVRVGETGAGKFQVRIENGRHVLVGDEPLKVGGDDTGPSPYEYLLASLGSCTVMTLRMYATHKGLPVSRIACELRHGRMHAKDCEECETKTGRIDRIERRLVIEGELDEAQRARMLEIADRCPVHRTLEGEIVVATQLAP